MSPSAAKQKKLRHASLSPSQIRVSDTTLLLWSVPDPVVDVLCPVDDMSGDESLGRPHGCRRMATSQRILQ